MSEELKTVKEWEIIVGVMFEKLSDKELEQTMTREDFEDFLFNQGHAWRGVDHENRVAFLEKNGFEVTRENMVEHRLSAGHKIMINGEPIDHEVYLAKHKG